MSAGAIVGLVIGCVLGVLGLLLVAGSLLGSESESSSSSIDAAAPVLPEDFALIEGDGVSIGAPERWEEIELDDLEMGSEAFAEAFPDAPAEVLDQGFTAVEQGAVLLAFDFRDPDFASNVNVIEAPSEAPLGEVTDYAEQELGMLGGELVESDIVELPAGDGVRVAYTLPVALPDGSSSSVEGVQYYVPTGGRTYIVTVTADATLADRMIETFRVG